MKSRNVNLVGKSARLAIVSSVAVSLLLGVSVQKADASPATSLVQITSVGGFVAPSWQASRLPQLTITSDGTAIVENQKPKHGYVREALTLRLGSAAANVFVSKLANALDTPAGGWGMPPVADMPNTRFVVAAGSRKIDVTVGAFSYQGSGLTAEQSKARKALAGLLSSMVAKVTRAKQVYKPAKYEIWGLTPILDNGGTGIANPASVYCQSSGGTTNIVDTPAGQVGYCQLPSGENVEEWANFRAALAKVPNWPAAVATPVNDPNDPMMTCTAAAATAVRKQLVNPDDSGRWILPSGQSLPVVLRPVLVGESACHRSW